MSSEVAVISLPVLEQDPVSSKQPQADHSPVADAEVAADEKPAAVLMEEIKQTIIMSQATTTATLTGKTTSDSEDLSEHVPESVSESGAVTTPPYEMADFNKTTNSSSHHDSEYDTASDTPSSGNELQNDDEEDEEDDDEDDFEDEDDELGDEEDDEDEVELDLERQRGDGEEQDGEKKKVDDDEDRSNPQYIPKRGVFYEHDDRTADEPESATKGEGDELNNDVKKSEEIAPVAKKPVKKSVERWSHDRFNANDQAPKSRTELVNSYGYDIRNEDGPPRAHRRRRYAGGPNKYTRKWEDESAYTKMSSQQQRNPRPEEFPELGNRKAQRNNAAAAAREEKTNKSNADESPQSLPQQRHRSPARPVRNNDRPTVSEDNDRTVPIDRQRSQLASSNERVEKQQQRFNNDKRPVENFDGFRQQAGGGDRFDNQREQRPSPRQDRFISGRNNDGFEQRHQNDRFDSGPRGSPRNERDRPQNDRPFARNTTGNNAASSGFRSVNIEFKNQARNVKPAEGPLAVNHQQQQAQPQKVQPPNNKPFNNSTGFNVARQQNYEYEEDARVEPHKYDFEPTERMPGDRAITGRQNMTTVNSTRVQNPLVSNNPGPLPLTNPSLLGNAPLPSIHQQPQPPASQIQVPISEATRPKRYSALRQRSGLDAAVGNQQIPQHVQTNPLVLHEQQLMMQDTAMLMQRQQQQQQQHLQDQIQLPPPNANYMQPQSLPAQQQQHQQQMLISSQQQSQQNVQPTAAQYQAAAYYATQTPAATQNDFPVPSVVNQQQQQQQQSPQTQQANQYTNQYAVVGPPSNPAYMSAAPPTLANAYLPQQQQPPVSVVTGQQQQQQQPPPVNYGPAGTSSGVQPQFAPVPSFPAYPPVANYNSVSSGITYYAPQTQPPPRPILPQRRPTNAIPILAPPERANLKNRLGGRSSSNVTADDDDDGGKAAGAASIGSPENIDHILDNMFVQRAPYQPTTVSAASTASLAKSTDVAAEVAISDISAADLDAGVTKMSISDLKLDPVVDAVNAHASLTPNISHDPIGETEAS